MNGRSFRPLLAALILSACSVTGPADSGDGPGDDIDDAIAEDGDAIDGGAGGDGKADDPTWRGTATLHAGDRTWDHAGAGSRQVHGLWAAGTADAPVPLTITVESADETPVRVAVLGPLDAAGKRAMIAAAGYSRSEERRVGKRVDLGGRGVIEKRKRNGGREQQESNS